MNTASAGSDPENDTNKKKEESTPLLRHSESSSVRFTKDTKPPSASERFRDFANLLFESFTEEARTRALEKRGVGPAAFLIRDAVLGEDEDPAEGAYDPYSQPEQGVRNVVSVVCRRLCSHRMVKFTTKMAAWTLVFLSFVEPPNWCRNFPLVTTDDEKASLVHGTCRHVMALQGPAPDDATLTVDYYPNTSTILLTVHEALLVEWACSTVLGLLLMLQIGRDGMSMTRYLRVGPARWVRGIELLAVTQLLVSLLIVDDYRGLAPFIRILVFFAFHRSSQREFGTLIKLMPEVLWVLSLLFVWLAFFAWIGVVAFYGSDQGTQHFPNLIEAMWTLWQMTTTVNYPDVMMPAYNENRVSVLYFVVYMVVTYFFLMNIILASVVNAYDNESEFRKKDHADKAESSLRQAFQLMDPEKEDVIDRDTVMALFLILNKDFPEFREIPNEEARILFAILDKDGSAVVSEEEFMCFGEILLLHFEKESSYATYIETHFPNLYKTLEYQRFCTIIKSDYFEYVIDVILVMNAIVVGIQSWPMLMGHTVDVDPHLEYGEIDTVWETFQTVFTIIYCVEAFVKVMVYGWKAYSEKHKNIFDLLITILSVAATAYVYYPNDFSDSAIIRLVVMARVFRLGRLLVALKPFRALIKISIDILPHTVNVMILLFIIMYFFAALGLELFGGWITRDPNNVKAHLLVGTDFADAAYWSNNFNDMSGGMNVLFNLLVINNWQVCSDGFEAVAGTLYTRFFFLSFHILGVIMVNNLVLAFIINSFIKEWDMFHEITHKEEVQGEAIIQDRKAVFDATQVTGSTTGLSGRYVARIEGGQLASERQQTILKYMFTSSCMMSALPHFLALKTKSGERLAYRRSPGNQPGYVFLNGFQSTMNSKKALAVEEHCRSIGRSCVCFDYRGHGESDGSFNDYCLSDWIDDASTILEELKCGPQILVGSSMGAWISLLLAMKRPSGVSGIICIAAGVDFTKDLERGMEKEQKLELETDGFFFRHSEYSDRPYAITKTLLDDSRQYYLMNDGCSAIPIDHPVILLHGQRDGDIPWDRSLQLAEKINSTNIVVTLIKDGNHRLSRPIDLVQIVKAVDTMTALASCHV